MPVMPQQPAVAAVRAVSTVKISSLFMAVSPIQNGIGGAAMGKNWVEQLYTTRRDVQTQRAGIFFATHLFFATHARRTDGIIFQCDSTSRASERFAYAARRSY
jgi:hypothetical protein